MKAQPHSLEGARLQRLASYGILDTPEEPEFDALVTLAAELCGTPVALISLVDRNRQWFKARRGLDVSETSLDRSICAHAILGTGPLVVEDTASDSRTADNPLCVGPDAFRFYAGAPIVDLSGLPLGSVCVLDTKPRTLGDAQLRQLTLLARQVMQLIRMREAVHRSEQVVQEANHRIKNSLQAAASNVRRHRRALGPDAAAAEAALVAVESSLGSAAELHDALSRVESHGKVELAEYVTRVIGLAMADAPSRIGTEIALAPCRIGADRAAALGTILSEFATNAQRHAFPGGRPGAIRVIGRFLEDGDYRIDLSDDGVGLRPAPQAETGSLGLKIIDGAIQQLNGRRLRDAPTGTGTLLPIAFRPD